MKEEVKMKEELSPKIFFCFLLFIFIVLGFTIYCLSTYIINERKIVLVEVEGEVICYTFTQYHNSIRVILRTNENRLVVVRTDYYYKIGETVVIKTDRRNICN